MKEETVFYQKNGLTVTDVRLEYRNTMHAIRNITMVQAYLYKPNNTTSIILWIAGALFLFFSMLAADNGDGGASIYIMAGIACVLIGFLLFKKDIYRLVVSNAGGARQTIFVSREKDAPAQMREIKDAILQAISSLAQ